MTLAERLRTLVRKTYRGSCDQDTRNALDKIFTLADEVESMEEYIDKLEDVIDHASVISRKSTPDTEWKSEEEFRAAWDKERPSSNKEAE